MNTESWTLTIRYPQRFVTILPTMPTQWWSVDQLMLVPSTISGTSLPTPRILVKKHSSQSCLGHHTFVKSSQFSSLATIDPNGGWGVVLGNNVPNNAAPFVVCVSSMFRNISILSDANTRGFDK